jgi:hypothetical protein
MIFTTPPNKNYAQDLKILYKTIKSGENITFSKFCDGEMAVLENKPINNKEFWFDPKSLIDSTKRNILLRAIQFKKQNYFVGITCVKVFGLENHRKLKMISNQDEDHLTWADLLVNSNYSYYVENIVPLFRERKVFLVCNENGKIENLPFKPSIVFPVKNNAWHEDWNLIQEIKEKTLNEKNIVVLFCCGPFGNILAYELTKNNPNNTYLDIGSTLNPWLQSESFNRHYYMGDNFFSRLKGEWDQ